MIQNLISSQNSKGNIAFTKSSLQNISELISTAPNPSSVFFMICSFIDDTNSLITNSYTLATLLNKEIPHVKSCLRYLCQKDFIVLKNVNVHYKRDIFGKVHDIRKYVQSNGQIWEPIGDKYINTVTIKNKFIKISVNPDLVSCTNGYYNTFLMYIKNYIYLDTRLKDSEIICGG